jgi:hypothetical protein
MISTPNRAAAPTTNAETATVNPCTKQPDLVEVPEAAQNGRERHDRPILTPSQTRLISALLISPTIKVACRRAKVSERAYRIWKDLPHFQAALAAAQRDAWSESVGLLKGLAPLAVRRLRRLLQVARPEVQLRAALGLLDRGLKAVEADDIVRRLDALEEHFQPNNDSSGLTEDAARRSTP